MPRMSVLKLVSSRRTLKKWGGKHILVISQLRLIRYKVFLKIEFACITLNRNLAKTFHGRSDTGSFLAL